MKTRPKIIKTIKKSPCTCCFRKGEKPSKSCKSCKGTGIYKDSHYIIIIGNFAIDMDTLK